MTGIERHWQEEAEKERQNMIRKLQVLKDKIAPELQMIAQLEAILWPQNQYANVALGGLAQAGNPSFVSSLLGGGLIGGGLGDWRC